MIFVHCLLFWQTLLLQKSDCLVGRCWSETLRNAFPWPQFRSWRFSKIARGWDPTKIQHPTCLPMSYWLVAVVYGLSWTPCFMAVMASSRQVPWQRSFGGPGEHWGNGWSYHIITSILGSGLSEFGAPILQESTGSGWWLGSWIWDNGWPLLTMCNHVLHDDVWHWHP